MGMFEYIKSKKSKYFYFTKVHYKFILHRSRSGTALGLM